MNKTNVGEILSPIFLILLVSVGVTLYMSDNSFGATGPSVLATPHGGTYNSTQLVTLTASVTPATIYYTLDGSTPTNSSTNGPSPITGIHISSTTTIKFFGMDSLGNVGPTATTGYAILAPLSVSVSPRGNATYTTPPSVNITSSRPSTIYYTLDGSTPTTSSTNGPSPITGIHISSTTTIKFFGMDSLGNVGPTATTGYTILAPLSVSVSPRGNATYTTPQSVNITSSRPSTIYYTLDGSTPTTSSTNGPSPITGIHISSTTTIKFFGKDSLGNVSPVTTASYTITPPPSCKVSISGPLLVNLGRPSTFSANVSGINTTKYQWTVTGNIIKDYQESVSAPWSITNMSATDYAQKSISFYWLPDPSQVDPNNATITRNVSVSISNGLCSSTLAVHVQRNTVSTSYQPEVIYVTQNHPIGSSTRVLAEHAAWHSSNDFTSSVYDGSLFFDFHNQFLSRFDSWRTTFGFPHIVPWNPKDQLPTGPAVDHQARRSSYIPLPLFSWFTINGGNQSRTMGGVIHETVACDTLAGQKKLADFPADRKLLGCTLTYQWHNGVHTRVGGDMLLLPTSPKDPMFFRFHKFVDGVSQNRTNLGSLLVNVNTDNSQNGLTTVSSLLTSSGKIADMSPQVTYQVPFRLFKYVTELPSISVTFGEDVSGVKASDLTVNGHAATKMTGKGAGPYIFTGFPVPKVVGPAIVPIAVNVKQGDIIGNHSNPFAGASWNYILLDPEADTDKDGISNYLEVHVYRTDPTSSDTDGDGFRDGYEVAHSCLDPLVPDTYPLNYDMTIVKNSTAFDYDHDGISNIDEYHHGTDPCVANK